MLYFCVMDLTMTTSVKVFFSLCNHSSVAFFATKSHQYYSCDHCKGIFMSDDDLPTMHDEVTRYLEHNNDISDVR